MKVKRFLVVILVLVVLLGSLLLSLNGCCSNPGVFSEIQKYKSMVQSTYYFIDGTISLPGTEYVAMGGIAADTALALAGSLQAMTCPPQQLVNQLELQVNALPLVKQ